MGFGWFWGLFSDTPISWDNYSWNASRFLNNVWMFMCFFWWIWLIWWIDGRRMLANLDSWWMVGFQRIWPIQCYFNPSQKQTWLATGQDPSPNISGTGTEPLALAKPRVFVCFFQMVSIHWISVGEMPQHGTHMSWFVVLFTGTIWNPEACRVWWKTAGWWRERGWMSFEL